MITIIKNACILTLDEEDRAILMGDIVVEDDKILALGPGSATAHDATADEVIDAEGHLAMPSLVNAHLHSTSAFMKGVFEGVPLEVLVLYDVPTGGFAHAPRLYYPRSMLSAIELLKQGVTAVRDDVH